MRERQKKRGEGKREKARLNDIKRREMGVRSAPHNSSRVFSTVIPAFTTGDTVTSRPATAGERLKATKEDWAVDSVNS